MYPRVSINTKYLNDNVDYLNKELAYIKDVYIVSKVFCAYSPIIELLNSWGYYKFADSRIENLKNIKQINTDNQTLQLRLPMESEVDELIQYADCSLNSELKTIKLIDKACAKENKTHNIILMIDVGDLREGIMFNEDYLSIVEEILKLKHINLIGLGTNITCYGSIIPTKETLEIVIDIKKDIEKTFNIELDEISGGNSSSIYLHFEDNLPKEVTNLRIGDAFVRGYETSYSKKIENMHHDVFQLNAQIIEIKNKPSFPIGKRGVNAFGQEVEYEDVGYHQRAILAIGLQDVNPDDLIGVDENIRILGASSDHLIIEVTGDDYNVGDIVSFNLKYGGILSLFTSKYVKKVIIDK